MKILDRIDDILDRLSDKLTEKIKLHEAKIGGKQYDDFFKEMLKKYKIKSYKDLPKDKQKKFFDEVDKAWDSKVEKGGDKLKKYKKGQSSVR